jgi:hypothetical protein
VEDGERDRGRGRGREGRREGGRRVRKREEMTRSECRPRKTVTYESDL